MLDINGIKKVLPHRYPFLLIDRILELNEGRVVAIKNITVNEPFSQEYFGGLYPMQGVLQVEAMAQTAAFLILDLSGEEGKLAYFSGIEKVRFRKPALAGDQLRIEVSLVKLRARAGKFKGTCYIGDEVSCEGTFTCMLAPDQTEPLK
ncbi:MAG TPA: 3-hydroxyacyl-ACP dehydratase FabZ [Firmicutes bacterium]|nr:3-hydroxyacyl-ACP dehydratase FabZ [Bacillota bacterium]